MGTAKLTSLQKEESCKIPFFFQHNIFFYFPHNGFPLNPLMNFFLKRPNLFELCHVMTIRIKSFYNISEFLVKIKFCHFFVLQMFEQSKQKKESRIKPKKIHDWLKLIFKPNVSKCHFVIRSTRRHPALAIILKHFLLVLFIPSYFLVGR